jgi:sugar phosphate isomerase/epimerase
MGQGVIELRRLRQAVEEAGYAGPIEVEVINRELWQQPGAAVVGDIVEAFVDHL